MTFHKGDKFKLTPDKDPWSTGDTHGHPGYDAGAGGKLYGSELPFDLYAWEMERA